jgi:hypothetical protein
MLSGNKREGHFVQPIVIKMDPSTNTLAKAYPTAGNTVLENIALRAAANSVGSH